MSKKACTILGLVFIMVSIFQSCSTEQKMVEYALYWDSESTAIQNSRAYQWNTIKDEHKTINSIPSDHTTTWAFLSPQDGKFVCASENDEEKRIGWSSCDEPWRVIERTPADSYIQNPYWMPDSSGFLYLKALEETQQGDFIHYASYELMQFVFSDESPHHISAFQSPVSSVSWSPNLTMVAFFAQTGKEMRLWSYHIKTSVLSSLCTVEADQFSKNRIHWVDENTIIWLEVKTLYAWDLGKQQKKPLLTMPEVILNFDFYLPSSSICMVYTLTEPTEKTVCVLYSWLNKKSQTLATGYQIDSPRFSPDGSKILFFLRRLSTTKPELMVFLLSKQDSFSICSVGKITIFPWDTNPTYAVWSPDSRLILLENKQDEYSNVQLYSVSPPRLMKDLVQAKYIYAYSFSPSGDWIRVLYPQDDQTKIILYHRLSQVIREFKGEWLGWSTEDFS